MEILTQEWYWKHKTIQVLYLGRSFKLLSRSLVVKNRPWRLISIRKNHSNILDHKIFIFLDESFQKSNPAKTSIRSYFNSIIDIALIISHNNVIHINHLNCPVLLNLLIFLFNEHVRKTSWTVKLTRVTGRLQIKIRPKDKRVCLKMI